MGIIPFLISNTYNMIKSENPNKYLIPLLTVGLLFFSLGFALGINGLLIPFLQKAFSLNNMESYLVLTATFSAFVVFGYPSGILIQKIGYKKGMVLSFALFAIGLYLFVPSAKLENFVFFLIASFICGTANTLLQAAINPYITILGPIDSAAKRMCGMTICNRAGWAIAPIFLALFIDITKADIQLSSLYLPFYIIAGIFVILGIITFIAPLPEIKALGEDEENESEESEEVKRFVASKKSVWEFPHLLLGVLTLFFFVGIDTLTLVSPVDFANTLGLANPERYTVYTVIAISTGCILGVLLVPKYLSQTNGLKIGSVLGLIISVLIIIVPAHISIYLVSFMSFSVSLVWGAVWPLAISYLGKYTKLGSSLLVSAIVGGAVLPLIFGWLKDLFGDIQKAYIIFIPCILFIAYYAFIGHKAGLKGIMKKTLTILILVFCAGFGSLSAQVINIETKNTALIYTVGADNKLTFSYLGEKLTDPQALLNEKYVSQMQWLTGESDFAYPSFGGRYLKEPALSVCHADGTLVTELIYTGTESLPSDKGVIHNVVHLKDKRLNFYVDLHTEAYADSDVLAQWVVVRNEEKGEAVLKNCFSSHLFIRANKYYLTNFYGGWGSEMTVKEEELTEGMKVIEAKNGIRTGHTENSAFIVSLDQPATENYGEVIGGALAWSGNYKMIYQVEQFRYLHLLGGINPFMSEIPLRQGEAFETPKFIFSYSNKGRGQLSRNLHDWARKYSLVDGFSPRPVIMNSWEGAGMNFTEKQICEMIDEAARLGVETFVLDDGWFGDTYPRTEESGLGDWNVDKRKLPNGVGYLADYAESKGIKFGIWLEPEMVNPKSKLAEKHPEWVVQSPGREKLTQRNQWLLDLTNPQVQDFVYNVVDNLLKTTPKISFIKWDANRHIDQLGSTYLPADRQSLFWTEHTKGLYKVYERIRQKYPDVIIEACASGGSRLDFGILKYHQEFWASDNTDPLQRLFIQYGTNLIYPPIATASHVSTTPNHQTFSITPLKFRINVAMTGRFGLEVFKPKDYNGNDRDFLIQAIKNYKQIRPLIAEGDLYRMHTPYDDSGWVSMQYVSKDKKCAVVFVFSIRYHQPNEITKLCLTGLDTSKKYKITEMNMVNESSWSNGQVLDGDFLVKKGIDVYPSKQYESAVFYLESNE